ncbi:hypothetical protein D3C71_23820 [compost metagenome]
MGASSVKDIRGLSRMAMLRNSAQLYSGATWTARNGALRCCLESLAPGFGGAYGVLAVTELATGETYRTALVIKVQRGGGEFCWKTMAESESPVLCAMPARLLNKLSPEDSIDASPSGVENAREWRVRARALAERANDAPEVGDHLEFEQPLTFRLGGQEVQVNRFEVLTWSRSKRFTALEPSGKQFRCRLTRDALARNYKVIRAAELADA